MLSNAVDDILPQAHILVRSKHLISVCRNEPLKRLSNEHELVVVFEWRPGKLRGLLGRHRL